MKTSMLVTAALGLHLAGLGLAACSGATTPPGGGGTADTGAPSAVPTLTTEPTGSAAITATPNPTTKPDAVGKMCGGIGGIRCPEGMVCKDDPSDDCDPAKGGRDCSGVCAPDAGPGPGSGNAACDKPERKYVARSAQTCASIRYFCEAGYKAFHDDCGCGCEPEGKGQSPQQGMTCRDKVCAQGQFCCNPSCGICAPVGGVCTQQVCP